MDISIIIPVFNEEKSLEKLHSQLVKALGGLSREFEIIFIDDASTDGSLKVLKKIKSLDKDVKVISLVRNYGQTQAISAGVDSSCGEIIVTIDSDLQNDPKDIPKLLSKIEEGFDVVSGWRLHRKDSFLLKKVPSFLANKISMFLTDIKIHDLGCTLKAYRRSVLENVEFRGEIHRFLPLCALMHGAKVTEVTVKHHKRRFGKSKYGILRVFKVILDALMLTFMWKFMTKPVYAFGGVGIFSLLISALVGIFIVFRKIFLGGVWVSPLLFILVVFFTIGVQFILMGILAEIIIQLYYGVEGKKRYKIK